MYSVFAMISAYDRSTSPRPVSTGQPGCTQDDAASAGRRRLVTPGQRGQPERRRARRSRRAPSPRRRPCWRLRPARRRCAGRHRAPSAAGWRPVGAPVRAPLDGAGDPYRVGGGPHLVHPDRPGARVGGERGDGGGGGVALARGRRARPRAGQDAAEEPLAGGGDQQRVAEGAQPVEVGQERQVVLGVLGEAEARVDDDAVGGDAAGQNGLHARVQFVDDLGDDVRVDAPDVAVPRGSPRQCMTTKGAPASAATAGTIAGSARPPLTSLTRAAPAARACSATAARMVSTETVTPSEARPRTTGTTRRAPRPRRRGWRPGGWTRRRRRPGRRPRRPGRGRA